MSPRSDTRRVLDTESFRWTFGHRLSAARSSADRRRFLVVALIVLLAELGGSNPGAAAESQQSIKPDAQLTPGAVRQDQTSSKNWICHHSTSEERNVALWLKKAVFKAYNVPWTDHDKYEVDHFVPLVLGGANKCTGNNTCNLWPQPHAKDFPGVAPWGSEAKDKLEAKLGRMVCANKLDLKTAQDAIRSDWVGAYRKYLGEP